MKAGWGGLALLLMAAAGYGQGGKPLGTVASADADVTRKNAAVTAVSGGRAEVFGGATVTAKAGRNAEVRLERGGSVLVCQSTAVQLTANEDAMLLTLDRGALEVRMKAGPDDAVMTPQMRLTFGDGGKGGELDLRMRVTFNGDTCVENRGRKSPQVNVSDAFGETAYLLKPGQHVMFEHGSLSSVMDRETTPCGCPPAAAAGVSIAEAVVRGGAMTPQQAAAAHPFPAAISDGLAPGDPGPPSVVGERRIEVGSTLSYDAGASAETKPAAAPAVAVAMGPPVAATQRKRNPFVAIGGFFKRLFVR